MFEWFAEWWIQTQTWLSDALDSMLFYLDPANLLVWALDELYYLLPPATDLEPYLQPIVQFTASVTPIYQYADYFVNMPVLAAIAGIILATETALALPRAWRFIRSFVT
jgi:hypothetical protein